MPVTQQVALPVSALVRFVAGMTGLHLAMLPAPLAGGAWDIPRLVAGCRARAPRSFGARSGSRCEACGRAHLQSALVAPRLGHDYEGPCGVRSFLLPVAGAAGPVGVLALRRGPADVPRGASAADTGEGLREAVFARAADLLRSMAREPVWSAAPGNEAVDGGPALPGAADAKSPPPREARSRQLVLGLIRRMQREFAEPLALKSLAWESGFNASYLSTAFTREAGLPFKSYLTTLRLEHAKALLRDPRLPISRVAREVGYASPNRFRAAFRAWTGLSPSHWRAARLQAGGR